MLRRGFAGTAAVTVVGLLTALATAGTAGAAPTDPSVSLSCVGSAQEGAVSCLARQLDNVSSWHGHHIGRLVSDSTPAGYGPAELQQAYDLSAASASEGRGKTVAVVDAYDDPFALADLAVYRAQFDLPPVCGGWTTRDCVTFTKVNQKGQTSPLPTPDPGWSQEISVDLDTVSAVCPNCNILLVEANEATLPSLARAEDTAAAAEPVSIGNSYGVAETSSETAYDSAYSHPGIAITAAAGDDGYGVQYPASSPDVIAVGGTTLVSAPDTARGWSETAWSSDGSGCSTVEAQPRWQATVAAVTAHCAGRAVADVSAVADPDTGVAVFDTYQLPGWTVFGGTSVATQIISALYALGNSSARTLSPAALYTASPGSFFDVTAGSDGTCGTDLCTATAGWDGPTGWGTPDGTTAF
jgi:subtilase family serine protease